jgi:hypothetical protein
MNAEQKHLNPSDLTTEQLDRIAFAIMGHLNRYGLFIPRPMKMKEAMAFCQVSRTTFQHWINIGKIKDHRVDEKGNPLFLPDEMYATIKNS